MEFRKILLFFLTWKFCLYLFLFLSISVLTLKFDFLGGGISEYLKNPTLWAFSNFDGERYLTTVQFGYTNLTYFFFPLYIILTRYFSVFFQGPVRYLIPALTISNFAFLVALFGLVKLIRIDYQNAIAKYSVIILLLFPTSFFFSGAYTESFFFALAVWAFYFARSGNWKIAGILGGLACLTRISGIVLFPALLIELIIQLKVKSFSDLTKLTKMGLSSIMALMLLPLCFLTYLYYIYTRTGDPLDFFHSLSFVFGKQRSSSIILLPQVFYRYIFRIIPSLSIHYLPLYYTTFLEFISALLFLTLSVYGFFRLRLSYAVYLFLGFLLPTLSGSFSSLPRYVLTLFPAFVLMAQVSLKLSTKIRVVFMIVFLILLAISSSLFFRGYWVS